MTMTGPRDETSHKNIQFSSRHTAVIQFEGWKQTDLHLCNAYKSPVGKFARADPTRIWEMS